MLSTTTPIIEGHPTKQYLGVVTGETIIGANTIKDFMTRLTDFFGGRSIICEKVFVGGKETVLKKLQQRAAASGTDAIMGIDLDYETVGTNGDMLMVTTNGMAVQV